MIVADETDLEVQYPRLNLVEMNPEGMESNLITMPLRPAPKPELEQPVSAEPEKMVKRWGPQGLYAIPGDLKDVQTPEVASAEDEEILMEELQVVAHFQLPLQSVYSMQGEALGTLRMLEQQREKKYQQMIHEGHEGIFHKDYPKALEAFQKALNYQESAEILTLIGWTQSLMGQLEKAKAYCLRAIQKDPDYGPPYNDLGSYFLTEGQIDESLKWFEMAKKSLHYQNREYPYINSGRAFMTKKDLPRALDEFSKALTIAPYHEDLHKTVEKLKKSLMRLGPTNPDAPATH
jgi:Tfp pilus assembly protein PilF